MDDDLMPNDSTFWMPKEPKEQVIARKKEKSEVLESKKVIEDLLGHFDQRIEHLGKIDSIQNVNILTKPQEFQKAFMVNKLLRQALIEEKELLEDLLDTNIPNR